MKWIPVPKENAERWYNVDGIFKIQKLVGSEKEGPNYQVFFNTGDWIYIDEEEFSRLKVIEIKDA